MSPYIILYVKLIKRQLEFGKVLHIYIAYFVFIFVCGFIAVSKIVKEG